MGGSAGVLDKDIGNGKHRRHAGPAARRRVGHLCDVTHAARLAEGGRAAHHANIHLLVSARLDERDLTADILRRCERSGYAVYRGEAPPRQACPVERRGHSCRSVRTRQS